MSESQEETVLSLAIDKGIRPTITRLTEEIMRLRAALAEAQARGRRQGLEEAAKICDEQKEISYRQRDTMHEESIGHGRWDLAGDIVRDAASTIRRRAAAPAETQKPETEWRQTGRGELGFGWSKNEWFRPSDGTLQMYPAYFDPNAGKYHNLVHETQKPETGESDRP